MMIVTQRNESFSQTGVSSWDSFGSANGGNSVNATNTNPTSKVVLESTALPWDGVIFASTVRTLVSFY